MDIEYDEHLRNNAVEYKKGLSGPEMIIPLINENPPTIYNPNSFQTEILLKFLQNKGILKPNRRCPVCLSEMNIVKDKWFGIGISHINTIESLWYNIKIITDNFSGLSVYTIKKRFNNNEDLIADYLDGGLCYSLLILDFKRK